MEEEEIPLKEFGSKFRDKKEDECKSDLEYSDSDLEKVVATDFPDKEEEETASRDWGTVEEDQADEDSLEEVVTIPSKIVDKEDGNGNLNKVKVRDIVKDSLGELKNNTPTQECDIPSDSSDVSLEEVCTIPNFIVDEEKWATADEEKAEKGVEGRNRARVISKTPSHESNMSDSSEVSLNETCTIPPNFINDEKETEKAKNNMTESAHKTPPTQEARSSSGSSEVSLEEIPSNFINDDEEEQESHKDDFRNQNLETVEEGEEIFDEESDEENVIRFPPEEEIEAMDEIPLDEAEVDEPIIEERGPRLSFSVVVRLIVAIQRLRQKSGMNSFAWALQPIQVTLNLGYYFLVVPFKIVLDKDGKFKIHVNPWQMGVSIFILNLVIIFKIWHTYIEKNEVSLQGPEEMLIFADNLFTTLMILAFLFIIGCKRAEIKALFEKFDLHMAASFQAYEWRKYKLILLTLVTMLFYFGLSNWKFWGDNFYNAGNQAWTYMFENGVYMFNLPKNNDSKLYFAVVAITTMLAGTYRHFLQYYINILMWSASIAVFNIVRHADNLFGRKRCFNLKKDCNLLRVVIEMVKKVSRMMGPIIVTFCLDIIPYTITVLFWVALKNFYDDGWIVLFDASLKLGHIFIACSASSNGSKLVQKVDRQIDQEPVEIFQIKGKMRILRKIQWNELINEFTRMTAEPISLTGMALFVINVQFLGAVALAVLTNGLLFAQWIRDSVPKDEPKCTCICLTANSTS